MQWILIPTVWYMNSSPISRQNFMCLQLMYITILCKSPVILELMKKIQTKNTQRLDNPYNIISHE